MPETQPAPTSSWPQLWPTLWLGGQFMVLGGLFAALDAKAMSALWDVAVGRRMLFAAIGLFAGNVAIYWPLSVFLLRRITDTQRENRTVWWVCQIGLTVACLVFLVAPAAFVLLVGPSAVQIQQNLTP